MVYADLHAHTTNSDGELTLDTLPDAARAADVSVVAITDHDRLHPDLHDPVTELDDLTGCRDGSDPDLTVVHGIELRVEAPEERVDLLGYGVTRTPELEAEIERLQADRRTRGRRIIRNVESCLDIDLDLEARDGIGRPHVARAVVAHPDTAYTEIGQVFDDLIGDGGPCFVARDVPDFERGRELLADACGLVGLAHPLRYDDPESALELTADLDAVERFYPYDRPVGNAPTDDGTDLVDAAIDAYDLLPTGGSDAHATTLGKAGLTESQYEAVARRL
ncbi:PHP domain-containing protein [Halocalculus aciditolerans]|uniref:Histidinol-phosphatase n=1 Tax=Halocalculus aciditolerans TaxID=1383812 RepID=A0A830FEB7_9EURY|nr:PHP domain-containing protein [Halocalculus aciditolerans]GGL46517.1 histidinol-phosphatase [Halocalculus aciditolerans]